MNRTNNIPTGIPNGRSTPERSWRQRWSLGCYGFSGFIGFEAFRAFSSNNPLFLFMFGFFCLFGLFQYWKQELKYLKRIRHFRLTCPSNVDYRNIQALERRVAQTKIKINQRYFGFLGFTGFAGFLSGNSTYYLFFMLFFFLCIYKTKNKGRNSFKR